MNKTNILVGLLVLLCAMFVIFQFNDMEFLSCVSRSLVVPIFTILYFQTVKRKSLYFSMFLILFSITEASTLINDKIPYAIVYFGGNSLYIAAYVFLILEVIKSLNFSFILNNYRMHVVVLLLLNVYIVYVLLKIVNPYVAQSSEFYIELIYNIVMLLLLSISLLNYFYRDDRKSLLMFLGSLCIVFSEVIQVAYLYIAERNLLIFSSALLSILAFYFFYTQASLKNDKIKSFA